jgi:hypothetical protein
MEYVSLGVAVGFIWLIFIGAVKSKSTVWQLKNREEYLVLAILASAMIGFSFLFLINFAEDQKMFQNKEIIVGVSLVTFFLLRSFIKKQKAPEEKALGDNVTQYRVFNDIDLENAFKERKGSLAKWNMQGDEAYEVVNVDVQQIHDVVTGFRDIITDDIGFPIDVKLTQTVRENLKLLLNDTAAFTQVAGYELSKNKKDISKYRLYDKIVQTLTGIYKLYSNVLGPLELGKRMDEYGSVELALLDAVNQLSIAKIPINLVQLYAISKTQKDQDVLGALKNITQEKTVQKEGIYLYSLYLIKQAIIAQKKQQVMQQEQIGGEENANSNG